MTYLPSSRINRCPVVSEFWIVFVGLWPGVSGEFSRSVVYRSLGKAQDGQNLKEGREMGFLKGPFILLKF
jgi:hypothetical protein